MMKVCEFAFIISKNAKYLTGHRPAAKLYTATSFWKFECSTVEQFLVPAATLAGGGRLEVTLEGYAADSNMIISPEGYVFTNYANFD